jgi:hypothetical protein
VVLLAIRSNTSLREFSITDETLYVLLFSDEEEEDTEDAKLLWDMLEEAEAIVDARRGVRVTSA